jgi:small GTP-binding protein
MGILLVYDVTQEITFNNVTNWLKQIESHASEDVVKILVANKIDLPNRVVGTEAGQSLAHEYGLTYFETSAMTGTNINELFYDAASQIIKLKPQVT